jgi:two-component system phosphate regulon sensor histidine kinase PhoR
MPASLTLPASTEILDLLEIPALLLQHDRILHANPAAVSMFGRHVIGQDVRLALRHPDAIELLTANRNDHVRVSGLSTSGSLWQIDSNGLADGTRLVTLTDLSVQESVARAHADFVANASHELRTPLAAVLGYVETLKDPKAGDNEATRLRFLDIIAKEANRMQSLVEDLMSLSRIEATKHQHPTEKVDLVAIARQCVGESAPQDRVQLETDLSQALISGDRAQLAQVIRNLIDNALKYGGTDTPALVRVEKGKSGWIVISVIDQGEGIAPQHMPRLTERFYRADPARSRQIGGTGLGLSIVKHIVERHRGRFDIASRLGHGTTATCLFPPF